MNNQHLSAYITLVYLNECKWLQFHPGRKRLNIKVVWFTRLNAVVQTVILVKPLGTLKPELKSTFQNV